MRDIVKFLLARMETHPEEFYQDKKSGVKFNWSHQIKDMKKFMTDDEYKAVWGKYSEINLERAMQNVAERLLAPEPVTREAVIGEFDDDGVLMQQLMKDELDAYKYTMKGRYESSKG